MTEQELNVLEQIWQGQTSWGPEFEHTLDSLEADDYIEIIQKHRESYSGRQAIDLIIVRITDEGSARVGTGGA